MDLTRFGFTPTETRVYLSLLRLGPATGYAVARDAHLARANTYSAFEALARRGAAIRLPGRPAKYSAAEPGPLLDRLKQEFVRDAEAAARELGAMARRGGGAAAPALELLENRAALIDRAGRCARGAREELLAVLGPWVPELYGDVEGASRRARSVRLLCLGDPAPQGATVRSVVLSEVSDYWGGLPLLLVADRQEGVSGILRPDGGAVGTSGRHEGLVPFLRHLLRRELAAAPAPHLS